MAKGSSTQKASSMKVMKVKKAKRVIRLRGTQDSFRSLLLNKLKKDGGRADIEVRSVSKAAMDGMLAVPLHKRCGYPVIRKKGSFDPKNWKTVEGKPVTVDFSREAWMPDEFAQGLKSTNKLACKMGGSGGTYTVYMNPEGRTFYHKWQIEETMGKDFKFKATNGWNGMLKQAELTFEQLRLDSESSFFKLLSAQERAHVRKTSDFHFAIVSARRTKSEKGLKGIATVAMAFRLGGAEPTWYVDAESLSEYRALGLKAVVGGRLTPARNMALRDARKQGKVCVQCSDDISQWDYRHGDMAKDHSMDAVNAAFDAAQQFVISPVTAAKFMLAKMRGAPEETKPRLGGVYCLGSCSRTFGGQPISRRHFVIGDFFVDDRSGIFFEDTLTLKEDYDFTCSHLRKYGSVMRFNRMTIAARHYTNEGGACSVRDAKGIQERKNMAILMTKWPDAIFHHRTRKNEVNLRWKKCNTEDDDDDSSAEEATKGKHESFKSKVAKTIRKMKVRVLKPAPFPLKSKIKLGSVQSRSEYITKRCKALVGKTVAEALSTFSYKDTHGKLMKYGVADLRYDIRTNSIALSK